MTCRDMFPTSRYHSRVPSSVMVIIDAARKFYVNAVVYNRPFHLSARNFDCFT